MTNNDEHATSARPAKTALASRLLMSVAACAFLVGTTAAWEVRAEAGKPWPQASAQATDLSQKAGQTAANLPDFASLTQAVKPAVVSVRVKAPAEQKMVNLPKGNPFEGTPFEKFFNQYGENNNGQNGEGDNGQQPKMSQALGSGFFISNDGYIVTNNHVVDKAVDVEIIMDDGTQLPAKVIGTDSKTDLALLKVSGRDDFPFVELASDAPPIGSWVVAMGNPYGFGGSVTAGIVSAHGRDLGSGPYDDFIQIDAAVNRGNSGGPTFNLQGKVIGVNTAIYSPTGGSVGIAFDIPSSTVKSVVEQLHEKGRVDRGWLGVQIQPVTKEIADSLGLKEASGALISEPLANGPAAKAGLKSGDIITAVNGTPVKDARGLAKFIGGLAPNNDVTLSVLRNQKAETFKVELGEYKDEKVASAQDESGDKGDVGKLGMTVAPASSVDGAGEHGLAVLNVDPDGEAADAGIQAGDVILKIAGKSISSAHDLKTALKEAGANGKKHTLALVQHENSQRFIALPASVG
ncbi:MAG: Do family serine endopeptidase [Hyphomicrobium sp.]